MAYSLIPRAELEVYKKLPNLKVVFDVGARDDIEYFELSPNAEFHLFEPYPLFFTQLEEKVGDRENVFLNNFGLGDKYEKRPYDPGTQSFLLPVINAPLPIRTLDWYVKKYGVKKIDFLKIDTEGWDYKVLVGGENILKNTRFIQYEHWDDKKIFHDLLEKDWDMEYIGYRNVLCMNNRLVDEETRQNIINFIRENKFGELV